MKRWMWAGLFVLASPWWWLFLRNPASFIIDSHDFLAYRDHYFVEKINTYQGQLKSKLIVNKYTWLTKEFGDRAMETLDPGLLFFTGDLDTRRSTRTYGGVLISLLPLVIVGVKNSNKKSKIISLGLIVICSLVSGLIPQHFYTPTRIPLFICYAWFAGLGMKKFSWNWYGAVILYDMVRFAHELVLHYLPIAPYI